MDDRFYFSEEADDEDVIQCAAWNILVVDDDIEVHQTTDLTLNQVKINNRPLNFFHSYSGAEAISFMKNSLDIDLILLDMVMETSDAGWEVARWLREDAGHPDSPTIILRTGQPGYISNEDLLHSKYINSVLEKTKATRPVLIDMLTELLPSHTASL